VTKPTKDGGLGFDFKWNMGWMHDTLRYFSKEPVHRKWHQNDLTFGMLYQYAENFVSVYSHDEVTHGKGSMLFKMGAWHIPEKAANLRALYGFMWAWPGKKLLFMGNDFGQSHEWNHAASLDWHLCQYQDHEGVRLLVRDLNRLYASEPALSRNDLNPQGFPVGVLQRCGGERDRLAAIGTRWNSDFRCRGPLYAGHPPRIPHRCSPPRILEGSHQYEQRVLWWQRPGKRRRPDDGRRGGGRLQTVAAPHASAVEHHDPKVGCQLREASGGRERLRRHPFNAGA